MLRLRGAEGDREGRSAELDGLASSGVVHRPALGARGLSPLSDVAGPDFGWTDSAPDRALRILSASFYPVASHPPNREAIETGVSLGQNPLPEWRLLGRNRSPGAPPHAAILPRIIAQR
ncbi:MAG: hypothetical protein ACAF42_00600 [Limnothrix sp. BL-A-16]